VSAETTKGAGTVSAEMRDPISRVRQTFAIAGESLVFDNWLEPGGELPPHSTRSRRSAGRSSTAAFSAAYPDCHGKEGVDGSSPSEGLAGTRCSSQPRARLALA
jgi:hypothetical protein